MGPRWYRSGLLNEYAASSPENDFNVYAGAVLGGDGRVWILAEQYPRIRRKLHLVEEFYRAIHPQLSRTHLRALARPNTAHTPTIPECLRAMAYYEGVARVADWDHGATDVRGAMRLALADAIERGGGLAPELLRKALADTRAALDAQHAMRIPSWIRRANLAWRLAHIDLEDGAPARALVIEAQWAARVSMDQRPDLAYRLLPELRDQQPLPKNETWVGG